MDREDACEGIRGGSANEWARGSKEPRVGRHSAGDDARSAQEPRDGRGGERGPQRHAARPAPEPEVERLREGVLLGPRRLHLNAALGRSGKERTPRLEDHEAVRVPQCGLDVACVDDAPFILWANEIEVGLGDGARGRIVRAPGRAGEGPGDERVERGEWARRLRRRAPGIVRLFPDEIVKNVRTAGFMC